MFPAKPTTETQVLTRDELHEEFAWGYIDKKGWTATPLLLMWLIKLIREADANS